ncbi:MAG TPA: enolase C-terminal domain-like protein [Rhodanobacteraceae bacterium]|jgi:L-fuconate dehydratase|nr:enolase C-terminal domain-like protein [Rhodanobacteraceae bacterium]
MARIVALEAGDIRFPTSRELIGSDAMNHDPDYSAVYVTLRSDAPSGLAGHALVFTIGRGNEVQAAAVRALSDLVVDREVDAVLGDLGTFARDLTGDSQLRWLGPEKGVMHMAIGGVVNAAWDMAARHAGQPLWRFIAALPPEAIVAAIDFRYLTDALTPDEALAILRRAQPGRAARVAELSRCGYPAYTTSPGWLGYSDGKLEALVRQAATDGFRTLKLKVGADLAEDVRRMRIARAAAGAGVAIAVDANQRWDVGEAIGWIRALAPFQPAWVEEPTNPDDVLGHVAIRAAVAPVPISSGEHTHNRVMFKQLLQAHAVDLLQIDAARVGGVNENLAILLLAAKFGVRVFPHAGGVGLCEMVQHLAMADFVAISGSMEDRAIEYVNHLHEHFSDPVRIRDGRYLAPAAPGFSTEMREASLREFAWPDGPAWH